MKTIKRRRLIKTALATSAVSVTPFNILKAGPLPSNKLNIACIGVGGMGSRDAVSLAREHNVIALCDVDERNSSGHLAKKKILHGIKQWRDYRVMYDKIGKEIDAIYIATPEHAHFTTTMFALYRDKHVYTQKPLCHTMNECRILVKEAKKHNVITQMGNQGHSTQSSALIRDWVQSGSIGEVRVVQAFSRKMYWTKTQPTKTMPVPPWLDWNLFLNRASEIPFNMEYVTHRGWVRNSHFSGVTGDMGAHILDAAYYSLDLRVPLSVHAQVPHPVASNMLPKAGVITWKFAARGKMPAVTLKYYLGPDIPFPRPKHLEPDRKSVCLESGSVIVGENASILIGAHSEGARIIPETTMKSTPRPPKTAYRCNAGTHLKNWTQTILGNNKEAMSNFNYSGLLSEIIVLGDIAMTHPNQTLLWDSKNMRITNNEAADKSLFMRRLNPRDNLNWM